MFPVGADTLVLGIETSCDDTGAAVVSGDGRVLGEALASQVEIHGPWGGVVPNLAQEAHKEAIDGVIAAALSNAGVTAADLSAVAVTVGPGLSMCLRVGVVAAQNLCALHDKPIIPVHHMEAHALVARVAGGTEAVRFPFLALLVSGGHNQLILARGVGDYTILGSTLDDALGEAYDKTARLLGLDVGGGGGPALEALAKKGDPDAYKFPVPLRQRKNCDFSYAGLKTAARMAIERDLGVGNSDAAFTKVHHPKS
jgi:glycoprotease/Kae1 family metallohydrolase